MCEKDKEPYDQTKRKTDDRYFNNRRREREKKGEKSATTTKKHHRQAHEQHWDRPERPRDVADARAIPRYDREQTTSMRGELHMRQAQTAGIPTARAAARKQAIPIHLRKTNAPIERAQQQAAGKPAGRHHSGARRSRHTSTRRPQPEQRPGAAS